MRQIRTVESFPLYWPEGYARTARPLRSSFKPGTIARARSFLRDEVRRIGGIDLVISTNIRTRADGDIYSSAREPDDAGVAVYFTLKGDHMALACDHWRMVWENTWAIAKTIDAMRGIDRWRVSELLARLFKGFLALPASIDDPWHVVLQVAPDASVATIRAAYRARTMEAHPDRGGSQAAMARINNAWDRALKERGGPR
jgi:hypothetical protein